jgi:hypothetical protein
MSLPKPCSAQPESPEVLVFIDSNEPQSALALRAVGPARVVDAAWLSPTPVSGLLSIRDFGQTAEAHAESSSLVEAALGLTQDWFSWLDAGPGGITVGMLVEDPLGMHLSLVAQHAAAVKACLLTVKPQRLVFLARVRTLWLSWTAVTAGALGFRPKWVRCSPLKTIIGRVRDSSWPLLSTVAHVARSSLGRLCGRIPDGRRVSERRYLFVADLPRADHIESLTRVAAELPTAGEWLLPWAPHDARTGARLLKDRGLQLLHLRDYFCWNSGAYETRTRFRLCRDVPKEIERLLGKHIAPWEYAWPLFRSLLRRAAWGVTPRAVGLLSAAKNLLRDRRPAAVLLLSDYNYTGRIVTAAARSHGIPTVQMQHGAAHCGTVWGLPILTNKIAVWDSFSMSWYSRHGVPAEQLCQTGNPRYDSLSETIPERDHLPPGNGPLVLVITDYLPVQETRGLLEATRTAVEQLGHRTRVLIKTHPCEDPVLIELFTRRWEGVPVKVQREGNSLSLVRQAAVVVAVRSTVAFEALLVGCPVVLVAFPGYSRFDHHPDTPFLIAQDEAAVAQFVQRLLTDPDYARECRQRCRDYTQKVWPLCGSGAARRVAELLQREAGIGQEVLSEVPMRPAACCP